MDWLETHWAFLWLWMQQNPWKSVMGAIVLCGAIGGLVKWLFGLRKDIREERSYQKEEKKKYIRGEIRRLKKEYRKEHQIPGQFSLGADYYVERIDADQSLVRGVVEMEGEKEI